MKANLWLLAVNNGARQQLGGGSTVHSSKRPIQNDDGDDDDDDRFGCWLSITTTGISRGVGSDEEAVFVGGVDGLDDIGVTFCRAERC